MSSDEQAAQMLRALNARLFPSPQKLLTHTLFNQGYRRYRVSLMDEHDHRMQATVWAQSPADVERLYLGRGMVMVQVDALPIGPFVGTQFPDGSVVGDVILIDEGEDPSND